jgi:hypothetical protein
MEPLCACRELKASNALPTIRHLYDTHVLRRGDWTVTDLLIWGVECLAVN